MNEYIHHLIIFIEEAKIEIFKKKPKKTTKTDKSFIHDGIAN